LGLQRGSVGFCWVYSGNEEVFRKKIEIAGLWEYKGNEGEEGTDYCELPFDINTWPSWYFSSKC